MQYEEDSMSLVSVVKCEDPAEGGVLAVSHLEAEGDLQVPNGVVFIKPNIVVSIPYQQAPAELTDPSLVAALIGYFYDHGAKKVIVGERPAWGGSCQDAYRVSGYGKIVTESGGILCDLDNEPEVWVPLDGHVLREIRLPKALVEADFFVNLPKAKTHFLTAVTVGIKNLFGCIRYEDRKKFHREFDLAFVLADVLKALPPDLTVVDAFQAMEGFGPHAGTAINLGLVIAGKEAVAVDTVGTYLMGVEPRSLAVLQVVERLGLGSIEMKRIRVIGEDPDLVRRRLVPPTFQFVSKYRNVHVYAGGVCPGCRPRIPSVPLNCEPFKSYAVIIGREPIAMRPDMEVDEVWLVGNCGVRAGMAYVLRRAFHGGFSKGAPKVVKVPGCPPLDWYSQRFVFPPLREKGWMT
jgi:uncharacterized protein (DUF362 family)